ncbi:MAG TPA: hypothetical protein VFX30_05885, partial [bacterium]|nr:hypothetical protein [bacterium]
MEDSKKPNREDKTIQEFCDRLSKITGERVEISSRPDKQNKGVGGCDAILGIQGKKVALEHTTVDSYEAQRKDSASFRKVIVPLEDFISKKMSNSWVEICIPSRSIPTGRDWTDITEKLKSDCLQEILKLPADDDFRTFNFPGVPFEVELARHEGAPGCYVMRRAPENRFRELENVIVNALKRKSDQLNSYKRDGYKVVLLLDSNDFVLMNRDNFAKAFEQAAKEVNLGNFDEIYYCETYREPAW